MSLYLLTDISCLFTYLHLGSVYLAPFVYLGSLCLPTYFLCLFPYLPAYITTCISCLFTYFLHLVSLYLTTYISGIFTYLPTYISCLFTYQYLGSLYLSTYLPTYISCLLQRYFWEYDFWDLVQRAITKIGWMCGFFFWVLRFFFCVSQCNAATANRLNPVIHSLCDRVLDYLFNIRLRRYNKENLSDSIEFNQVGEL